MATGFFHVEDFAEPGYKLVKQTLTIASLETVTGLHRHSCREHLEMCTGMVIYLFGSSAAQLI